MDLKVPREVDLTCLPDLLTTRAKSSMKRAVEVTRTTARHLSTRGPRGPRSIVDKTRTPSRIGQASRAPRAASHLPESNRFQSSQPHQTPQKDPQQNAQQNSQPPENHEQPSKVELVSSALAANESSDLLAPVDIPDDPNGVLSKSHPAMSLLNNSSLVIQRQIEMMNVFLGFEQANKYVIMNGRGETIGYMAEQDHGLGNALARQAFRTHRSFTAHIFDADQREVLRIHRPFSWISSRIRIYDPCSASETYVDSASTKETSPASAIDPAAAAHVSSLALSDMRIVGEAQQQWAPLRRKYNLFTYRPIDAPNDDANVPKLPSGDLPNTESKALTVAQQPEQAIEAGMTQFSYVNEPWLSWDFTLKDAEDNVRGSVNRNFAGFAREIFTDTGVYVLRMDSASLAQEPGHLISQTGKEEGQEHTALTLDQRSVILATAVCIDFDYFSRHSGAGGGGMGFFPMWFPGMGGAAEGGAAGGAVGGAAGAGEVGAAEGAAGAVGNAARGAGVGEGAITGAGTMAGYEAMQRGRNQQQDPDDASPTASNDPYQQGPQQSGQQSGDQTPWGEQPGQQDPWAQQDNDPWNQGGSGGSGGGGGGGGDAGGGFDWGDWF